MFRLRVGVLLLNVLLAGCGRVTQQENPQAVAQGGETSASAPPDAGTADPGSLCAPAGPGSLRWAKPIQAETSSAPQGVATCGSDLCVLLSDDQLIKLTKKGELLWSRRIEGLSGSQDFHATSIGANSFGSIAVAGWCSGQLVVTTQDGARTALDCPSGQNPLIVLHFDHLGVLLSSDSLGTPPNFPPIARVAIDVHGRSIAAALIGGGQGEDMRTEVVARSADGVELFRHSFVGLAHPADIAIDAEGNTVLSAFLSDVTSVDDGNFDAGTPLDTSGSDLCALKLDSRGKLLWSHCAGGNNQSDLVPQLALGPDGSIFLAGSFSRDLDFASITPQSSTRMSAGPDNIDMYVAKLSSEGDFAWQRHFGSPDDQDARFGLTATPEGGLLFAAKTRDSLEIGDFHVDANSPSSPFIAELDANGRPAFVTQLGRSAEIEGAHGLVLGECGDFYLVTDYLGMLSIPVTSNGIGPLLIAGRY
ncbi:MAG TPA: hypothetical protein VGC79_21440 [Polyangiaceae bacterium]